MELKRAQLVKGEWIDTDFYKGFMQRERKDDYIAQLEKDWEIMVAGEGGNTDAQGDEAAASDAVEPNHECLLEENRKKEEELVIESVYPGFKRRKAQFEYRLRRLKEQIEECEDRRLRLIG
ncbi:unnamed protein product, partial [Chrysoparadoxa australica]